MFRQDVVMGITSTRAGDSPRSGGIGGKNVVKRKKEEVSCRKKESIKSRTIGSWAGQFFACFVSSPNRVEGEFCDPIALVLRRRNYPLGTTRP